MNQIKVISYKEKNDWNLKLNTNSKRKNQRRIECIKMDKSDEFIKSGKKLISEYDGANLKEDEDQKPELLNEEVLLS